MLKKFGVFLLMSVFAFMVSCASIQDAAVSGAVSGLSRAASEHVEQAVYKELAPKEKLPAPKTPGWGSFMAMQAQVVFSYTFSAGGMWLGQTGYKQGEWTKFEMSSEGDSKPVVLERAFLKRLGNGDEWWRTSWEADGESWIYEALISKKDGTLLRLRARDTDGNEGEVPVSNQQIYNEPQEVSAESIKGATIGTETITVPAGTFTAKHVRFINQGQGNVDWWLNDTVPGGVVKYEMSENGTVKWKSELKAKGGNATTILNSF